MRSKRPSRIFNGMISLVLLAGLCSSACSKKRYLQAQVVADAGNGKFWVCGSEGFAAFFDGQTYHRRDYPRRSDAPDWAYEIGTSYPATHILVEAGQAYLFSRIGDVSRWGPQTWTPIATIAPAGSDHAQLNQVLHAPGGGLVILFHSNDLAWTRFEDLAKPLPKPEKTPTFFSWLDFTGEALTGLGWDESGNVRAIRRRRGPGNWPILARFGDTPLRHFQSLVRLPNGELAAVALGGLQRLPAKESVTASRGQPCNAKQVRSGPDPQVAKAVSERLGFVAGQAQVEGRGAFLFGAGDTLELTTGNHAVWDCPGSDRIAVGAVPIPAGIRLVTRKAAVWDLVDGKCSQVSPPLLK
jgi:hypothetical protein